MAVCTRCGGSGVEPQQVDDLSYAGLLTHYWSDIEDRDYLAFLLLHANDQKMNPYYCVWWVGDGDSDWLSRVYNALGLLETKLYRYIEEERNSNLKRARVALSIYIQRIRSWANPRHTDGNWGGDGQPGFEGPAFDMSFLTPGLVPEPLASDLMKVCVASNNWLSDSKYERARRSI